MNKSRLSVTQRVVNSVWKTVKDVGRSPRTDLEDEAQRAARLWRRRNCVAGSGDAALESDPE